MTDRPPPYMYNAPPLENQFIPIAPPMDNIDQINYQQPTQNYMTSHPSYPAPIYIPPPYNEKNRKEEVKKNKNEEECWCMGLCLYCICCYDDD
jgi:hypothetical protein